jgi:hypothetical protein
MFLSETHPSDYFKLYGNEHQFLATIFPLFAEAQIACWSSKTVADVQDDGDNDNIAWVAAVVYMTVTFGLTLLVMKFVDIARSHLEHHHRIDHLHFTWYFFMSSYGLNYLFCLHVVLVMKK